MNYEEIEASEKGLIVCAKKSVPRIIIVIKLQTRSSKLY